MKKEMSPSQRQAVITLIEKQDKDRTYLENWRPISSTNVDAKIASKVIATRIVKLLPEIIHSNQTGYVLGRGYIGEAARSILDIMDYTKTYDIPGLLLFIDFEKASDSLEWNFMFKCLEVFGFGPSLTRWIETFYSNITSIINNGTLSASFEINRGVRQGGPLSPDLFIIAVELFSSRYWLMLRNKRNQNRFKRIQNGAICR